MIKNWPNSCKCTSRHIETSTEYPFNECATCGKIALPKRGHTYTLIGDPIITADFPDDKQFIGKQVVVLGYEGYTQDEDVAPLVTCLIKGTSTTWNFFVTMFDLNIG